MSIKIIDFKNTETGVAAIQEGNYPIVRVGQVYRGTTGRIAEIVEILVNNGVEIVMTYRDDGSKCYLMGSSFLFNEFSPMDCIPHESGNVGLPCSDGSTLYFTRTGNGVWQARRGDLFYTIRVSDDLRKNPPRLHYFDEVNPIYIEDAFKYLGEKWDRPRCLA
jgi:hypothetical protein